MGLAGFFLVGFLLVHLGGNLLLYVNFESYNHYAHALHASPILKVAEVGLLVLFAVHILWALGLSWQNQKARPIAYAVKRSKQGEHAWSPSAFMLVSGTIVFIFILLHLSDFRFALRLVGPEDEEKATRALRILQNPITMTVYFFGSLFIGYHLWHGFQSFFQTFGLRHPKYTPCIQKIGIFLAVIFALGFVSFPIWALLIKWGILS